MISNLYYLILLLAGFPAGLLLARLCRDEIKNWKKRLFIISIMSLILAIVVSFIPFDIFIYKFPVIVTLFFIIITCLTIAWKTY